MAMLPFCGYHIGDYFHHWLDVGQRLAEPPKIFHVNWFRTDENGKYLWPGYGENLRVIEWILRRCRGEADAQETPIGFVPTTDSLDVTGLDIDRPTLRKLFAVNREEWKDEHQQVTTFFEKIGSRMPKELWQQHAELSQRLEAPVHFLKPGTEVRPLAAELNETLREENPALYEMLSDLGRRLYFPKGILAQSAEAKEKAHRFDATIGIAREGGKPMFLPAVMEHFADLSPAEALAYAPATGRPDLRAQWRAQLLAKNPSLAGKSFSTPIVTNGVTHALSLVGDLFVNPGDLVLLPDKFWENYELLFGVRLQAQIASYPFFNEEGGFNVEGLRHALQSRTDDGKALLVLNIPNNPTGYSIRAAEADALVNVLRDAADEGRELVVVTDDAYFGLFYEADALQESLFARLAGCHERIVTVKVDGPTKEEYVWGFRVGMLTFSARAANSDEALYGALERKVAGAIRSTISNGAQPSQSVLVKAMADAQFAAQRQQKREILEARAKKVQEILTNPAFADLWTPYPFNAGYFMCLRLKGLDAERYRKYLLDNYGVGVIADGPQDIRVAFSAVELEQLPELFSILATAARELKSEKA